MLKLKQVMLDHGITVGALAAAVKQSNGQAFGVAAMSVLINHGRWPRATPEPLVEIQIYDFLRSRGVNKKLFEGVFEVVSGCANTPEPGSIDDETKGVDMLLRKQTLSHTAKTHFSLARDPFSDEARCVEDVFLTPRMREIRDHMESAMMHGRFVAVVGESGSGKTTLREMVEEQALLSGANLVLIRPYSILGMEDSDTKGRSMKVGAITDAIIRCIAPQIAPKRSTEARYSQMHELLLESVKAGRRHCLVIEESHALPTATLKHLKRLRELPKHGMTPLLGVLLLGQTELADRLSETDPNVREVVQRCELVTLGPLERHLPEFVAHRFARVGATASAVFDADAVAAIGDKLNFVHERHTRSGGVSKKEKITTSLVYPLAVCNVATAAMNLAADLGAPKVTAAHVARI